jgi:hypothetical protein
MIGLTKIESNIKYNRVKPTTKGENCIDCINIKKAEKSVYKKILLLN